MGWTSVEHYTRDQVVSEITGDPYWHVLDMEDTGRHVWYAVEIQTNAGPVRFVLLQLIRGSAWKLIDETMGPVLTDCPLRLLEACPLEQMGNLRGFAAAWREKVRRRWKDRPGVDLVPHLPFGADR